MGSRKCTASCTRQVPPWFLSIYLSTTTTTIQPFHFCDRQRTICRVFVAGVTTVTTVVMLSRWVALGGDNCGFPHSLALLS